MNHPANPFPGPQPYGPGDRDAFFGRDRAILHLSDAVMACRVLTVFGPSGAGKSSLLQAGVLPALEDSWGVRVVVVDAWPPRRLGEQGPVGWLVGKLCEQLGVGPAGTLDEALHLAYQRSDRGIVLVLDQLEQLLADQDYPELQALADALSALASASGMSLHVVLSLREDWFGRWTALLRGRPRLVQETFRLARLSVEDMVAAVESALRVGRPAQGWDAVRLRSLIAEMAVPGQWRTDAAEVESAYVQIVCRVLWERGGLSAAEHSSAANILDAHLQTTLLSLGPLGAPAERLLQERLVTAAGTRVPIPREVAVEAIGSAPDAERILHTLEGARILRAQAHEGDRIYELGHDWLARSIRESADRRRAARDARRRRVRAAVVGLVLGAALLTVGAFGWLWWDAARAETRAIKEAGRAQNAEYKAIAAERQARKDQGKAQTAEAAAKEALVRARASEEAARASETAAVASASAAERARRAALEARADAVEAATQAERARSRAEDSLRLLAARAHAASPRLAAAFLHDIERPADQPGWLGLAVDTLQLPVPQRRGAVGPVPEGAAGLVMPGGGPLVIAGADGQLSAVSLAPGATGVVERTGLPVSSEEDLARAVLAAGPGGELAVGLPDGSVWSWMPGSSAAPCRRLGHDSRVSALGFAPQGALHSADLRGEVKIAASADVRGACRPAPTVTAAAAGGEPVWSFVPDGDQLWGLTGSGRLLSMVPEAGRAIDMVRGDVTVGQGLVSRAGLVLAAGAQPLRVAVDGVPPRGARARAGAMGAGAAGFVRDMAVDEDGALVLILTADGTPQLHRWQSDGTSAGFVLLDTLVPPDAPDAQAHLVALDPAGRAAAVAHLGGTTTLWHLDAGGRPMLRQDLRGSAPSSVLAFSDGSLLDVRGDGAVLEWSLRPPPFVEVLATPEGEHRVRGLCFVGDAVVATTEEGVGLSWDADGARTPTVDGDPTACPGGDGDGASAGGRSVAVGAAGGVVQQATGDSILLRAHPHPVTHIALRPDGEVVASTDGRTVLRWTLGPAADPWSAWQDRLEQGLAGWCLPAADLQAALNMGAERAAAEHAACVGASRSGAAR